MAWAIDTTKLYLCHGIMTCTSCCAKSLGPAKAIVNVKAEVAEKYERGPYGAGKKQTETRLPPASLGAGSSPCGRTTGTPRDRGWSPRGGEGGARQRWGGPHGRGRARDRADASEAEKALQAASKARQAQLIQATAATKRNFDAVAVRIRLPSRRSGRHGTRRRTSASSCSGSTTLPRP